MKKTIIVLAVFTGIILLANVVQAAIYLDPNYLLQWSSSDPSRVLVDINTGKMTRIWSGAVQVCYKNKSALHINVCQTVN